MFISAIVKGGAAELDGRLTQGDQILAVNGEDMRSASQETVATILKVSPESRPLALPGHVGSTDLPLHTWSLQSWGCAELCSPLGGPFSTCPAPLPLRDCGPGPGVAHGDQGFAAF